MPTSILPKLLICTALASGPAGPSASPPGPPGCFVEKTILRSARTPAEIDPPPPLAKGGQGGWSRRDQLRDRGAIGFRGIGERVLDRQILSLLPPWGSVGAGGLRAPGFDRQVAHAPNRGVGPSTLILPHKGGGDQIKAPSLVRLTHDGLDKYRPSWSSDGRRLLFARREPDGSHIWQYVLDVRNGKSTVRRLTDRKDPEYNGVFSPDGARVLFAAITLSGTQGNLDIAVVNADGTGLKTVISDQGKLAHQDWPSWSPDGRRFAFTSTHEGNQEIYTAAADGTDLVRVTQSPGLDAHPAWSPDGCKIAFATDRWGGLELAAAKPDGTGLVRLTRSPGLDDYPAYSPDGSRLAFVSNRDGQFEVYLAAADGSDPFNLSRHPLRDTFPTWRPDGRGVTFVSNREGGFELYMQALEPLDAAKK